MQPVTVCASELNAQSRRREVFSGVWRGLCGKLAFAESLWRPCVIIERHEDPGKFSAQVVEVEIVRSKWVIFIPFRVQPSFLKMDNPRFPSVMQWCGQKSILSPLWALESESILSEDLFSVKIFERLCCWKMSTSERCTPVHDFLNPSRGVLGPILHDQILKYIILYILSLFNSFVLCCAIPVLTRHDYWFSCL